MIFYRLNVSPPEEEIGGGDHWDEWFTSLAEAKRGRAERIQGNPCLTGLHWGQTFSIDKVTLPKPSKSLIFCLLNGVQDLPSEEVVPAYSPSLETLTARFYHPGDNDDHGLGDGY